VKSRCGVSKKPSCFKKLSSRLSVPQDTTAISEKDILFIIVFLSACLGHAKTVCSHEHEFKVF
jgi:hypothetical protein